MARPTAAPPPGPRHRRGGAHVRDRHPDRFRDHAVRNQCPAGPVLFQALNSGTVPHRFVVVRTNLEPSALPATGDRVNLAALEVTGAIERVAPTNTESYAAGMHAGFTVR